MARDPLHTLRQLRRRELDAARAELVACETRVAAAAQAEKEALSQIQREMQAAALSADDAAVEAFGRWLPVGRAAVSRAGEALARAEDATAQARAALNLARAAEEAVTTLIDKRAAEAAREAGRREQSALDEMGQRRRRPDER